MNTHSIFTTKAERYAKYRWDYSPLAIEAMLCMACINPGSVIVDLGAGTGILTRHLVAGAGKVFALEPNPEMGKQAQITLRSLPRCAILRACAETIPLPDHSIDLITVATAIHWFDPQPARAEIRRILKPGGWLAVLSNTGTDEQPGKSIEALMTPDYGVLQTQTSRPKERRPVDFYYGDAEFRVLKFPFSFNESWEGFFGALLSTSYIPDDNHPLFQKFEGAVQQVFEQFSKDGWLEVHGETELIIGQP